MSYLNNTYTEVQNETSNGIELSELKFLSNETGIDLEFIVELHDKELEVSEDLKWNGFVETLAENVEEELSESVLELAE